MPIVVDPLSAFDWYLSDWLKQLGKRQADIVRDLGWEKARASKVVNSVTEYRRDTVNELAAWLGIQPYELLMPPREALALRRLRETAAMIVGETEVAYERRGSAIASPPRRRGRAQ